MAKDKNEFSKPLFEDPFAELDDSDLTSGALEEPNSGSDHQPPSKTSAKPKNNKKEATATKPKTTSRKRAAKKKSPVSKAKQKTATQAKSKTSSRKRTERKNAAESKAKKKTTLPKRTAKKKPAKTKTEKKTTFSAKSSVSAQKRSGKKLTAKPKIQTESKTELKPEIPSPKMKDKGKFETEIVEKETLGEDGAIKDQSEDFQASESTPTLLETLITSLEKGDKDDDRRALAALPFVRKVEQIEGEQHIVFALAQREYATHIENVLEIGEPLSTTPVPNVPEWILGVANLRGDIISVIDLRMFFGLPPSRQGEESRMVVMQSRDRELSACFLVDEVRGIRYIEMKQIFKHETTELEPLAEYVDGFYEHEGHKLMVLNVERLLLSKRMQAV